MARGKWTYLEVVQLVERAAQSGSVILTQLAYHKGASGSRYTGGANGEALERQVVETCLFILAAVTEIGLEEGLKA